MTIEPVDRSNNRLTYQIINRSIDQSIAITEYVNPFGTVPCLYVDGKGVFESTVICEFVEDAFPEARSSCPTVRPWFDLEFGFGEYGISNQLIDYRCLRPRRHPAPRLALQRAHHPPALPLVHGFANLNRSIHLHRHPNPRPSHPVHGSLKAQMPTEVKLT